MTHLVFMEEKREKWEKLLKQMDIGDQVVIVEVRNDLKALDRLVADSTIDPVEYAYNGKHIDWFMGE